MARDEPDPDIRSIVDAAAASWSQRSHPPDIAVSSLSHNKSKSVDSLGIQRSPGPPPLDHVRSDINAWKSALAVLPKDMKDKGGPVDPLAQALAEQPSIRPVEWNQHRQQGSFVPRTGPDCSALMIYLCGQVNPNPCHNCIMKNGPFAQCIVASPSVLSQSTLRHACANCTYQHQYKKCSNAPRSQQEYARSQLGRVGTKAQSSVQYQTNVIPKVTIPKKSKPHPPKPPQQSFGHMVQKPSNKSISADSFAEKLRQSLEAEKSRTNHSASAALEYSQISPITQPPSRPTAPALGRSNRLRLMDPSAVDMHIDNGHGEFEIREVVDEDESDSDEELDREHTWMGFDDPQFIIKPPR
ncbi:hypothetical protein F5Y15DRAFT_418795 [Xylariaceae sp. FL0016]|nr:hypothetical protein F5Y15DRAFT_418795 [Xylariaceae sp. FL0016]